MPTSDECEPRYQVAGLLAFHLVSQVLDEARTIANAASESGQPWLEYLAKRKNTMPDMTYVIPSDEGAYSGAPYVSTDGVGDAAKEPAAHTLVTSTPQKLSDNSSKAEKIIGQGDEDIELQIKINKCTSMYINQLFDMSDVENTVGDDIEEKTSESIEKLAKTITQMMQSSADIKALVNNQQKEEALIDNESRSTGHSSYSFLEVDDVGRDYMFFADDEVPSCTDKVSELAQTATTSRTVLQQHDLMKQRKIESSELYENSYLTMNRDYDQCSDDEGYPILQDPKGMTMQEIELLTSNTSEDSDAPEHEAEEKDKERGGLAATSAVSASSRKSSLARRCRIQGARLLACLRGWWRRKTPAARRKENQQQGPCGRCPLTSPIGRRRAATLQTRLSPAPARVAWRFNTLTEALAHSSIAKDYTFVKPSDFGDVSGQDLQ